MCDNCDKMWKDAQIKIQYNKTQGRDAGNGLMVEFGKEKGEMDPADMMYLIAYAVADIFEIGSQLLINMSDNGMQKKEAYFILADLIEKILNERHAPSVSETIPRDEKAHFIKKFVETRNKMQK